MEREKSQALFEKYRNIVPGGVHSNFRRPYYFERAQGSRLWDVDGNEYIDCIVNNGACILGHADKDVKEAVIRSLDHGLTSSMEAELSMKVAKQIHDIVPSAEQVRFANSGTEAVLKALMIARAYKKKEKIIKVEGGFHGWFDEVQVSVHPDPSKTGPVQTPKAVLSTGGVRRNTTDSVRIISFNQLDSLEEVLEANKGEVAAILMEPVMFNSGCILPKPGYLDGVRTLADKYHVVLIFDEVITGFRLAPGGAQERYGVVPDMSVFAKAIANGYPLSAVVGRKDIMELSRPGGTVIYGGTYNGQQAAVAAASVCIEKIKDGKIQRHLQAMTQQLEVEFSQMAKEHGVSAQLKQCGGQFQVYFTESDITDYRAAYTSDQDKYKRFHRTVFNEGLWFYDGFLFHHGVTDAHTEGDIDRILKAFDKGLIAVSNY